MKRHRAIVHTIDFRIIPQVDTVLMLEGQRYVVAGSRLHRRADGNRVPLILWQSHCATCGESFECATTLKAQSPNRRCEIHHRPGLAVTARGKTNQAAFRTTKRRGKTTR